MAYRAIKAFTLIELLVVISIIALLVGILLPVLGSARRTARTSVCLNNIRQLTIASIGYFNDSDGRYPRAFDTNTNATYLTNAQVGSSLWFNAVDYYVDLPPKNYSAGNTAERNYSKFKQDPIWNDGVINGSSLGQQGNRTFKMNSEFRDGIPRPVKDFAREFDLAKRNGPIVWYFDGRAQDVRGTDTGSAGQFSAGAGTVALRHGEGDDDKGQPAGSANVAFTDGHASTETERVNTGGAAPSWFTETAANIANGNQTLSWRFIKP